MMVNGGNNLTEMNKILITVNNFNNLKGFNLVPVRSSPEVLRSELVFVYEKPTPAGDSRNKMFASARVEENVIVVIR